MRIDIAPIKRRSGRLLGITHVGTYHEVIAQPLDRRTGVVVNLRYVITVTTRAVSSKRGSRIGDYLVSTHRFSGAFVLCANFIDMI